MAATKKRSPKRDLEQINRKILAKGETLPIVRLKDGTPVQTGTVAAMLRNIELYNRGARGAVERELVMAIPTLFKIGLFGLFKPQEWAAGDNPGRRFVGQKALELLANSIAQVG